MYCIHCGKMIADNSRFCPACGQAIPQGLHTAQAQTEVQNRRDGGSRPSENNRTNSASGDIGTNSASENQRGNSRAGNGRAAGVTPASKTGRSGGRRSAGVIAAVIVTIAAIGILAGGIFLYKGRLFGTRQAVHIENSLISGEVDSDGTAYIPLMDGNVITIDGENVEKAILTRDRKHVVVLLEDGTLYITDSQQSSRHEIADDVAYLTMVYDDGIFYRDGRDEQDHSMYWVSYADYEPQLLFDEADEYDTPLHDMAGMMYAVDGEIYTFRAEDDAARNIGTYDYDISLRYISDDTQIAIWDDHNGDDHTIMLYNNGDTEMLMEIYEEDLFPYISYSCDGGLVTMVVNDTLWIIEPSKETIEVRLESDAPEYGTSIYTNCGPLYHVDAGDVTTLYVMMAGNEFYDLYAVTLDGDCECVLSGIQRVQVYNGWIVYTDARKQLYVARINDDEIEDPECIDSNVSFIYTVMSDYVYYMKDIDDSQGVLYGYQFGKDDPVKISAAPPVAQVTSYLSSDGRTIYFYKDQNREAFTGTLYKWSYGDEKPTMIDADVSTMFGPFSGISSIGYSWILDSNGFTYKIIDGGNSSYMYYDGERSTEIF